MYKRIILLGLMYQILIVLTLACTILRPVGVKCSSVLASTLISWTCEGPLYSSTFPPNFLEEIQLCPECIHRETRKSEAPPYQDECQC